MTNPMYSEAELRAYDRQQKDQQYSYDLTQKLTYFIVSVQLVFCGYVLLNFDKFGQIKHASLLFLISGLAAFCGILWRFFYNQNYHNNAHSESSGTLLKFAQNIAYYLYILFTIGFFILLLVAGYNQLAKTEKGIQVEKTVPIEIQKPANPVPTKPNKTIQPTPKGAD